MKPLRPGKKWVLAAIGLLLALFILKIVLFLTAKPKITVDYVAEYNRISCPQDYDPNDNADELYKKAGAVFVPPSEIVIWASYKLDTDINEADKIVLREWLEKNRQCIKYIEEGNKKKFFWAEENEENEGELYPKNLGPENIFQLSWLLEKHAKVAAIDGQFEDALISLIECWKIGAHYTNPKSLLANQIHGLMTKERVLKTALSILDLHKIDAENLQVWQKSWKEEFEKDEYVPSFQTERLVYYDLIQRSFVDNGRGTGRLAWKMAKNFTALCGQLYNLRIYLSCLTGPNKKEVTEIVNSVFDHYEKAIEKTPWEIRIVEQDYRAKVEQIMGNDPILNSFIPSLDSYCFCYYRLRAYSEALITAISVLRYKADNGNYPKNLDQLIHQKYLTKLPRDPFSTGPLIYNLLDDDFELYSIEKDFRDDGAGRFQGGNPISGIPRGDEVFWPPLSKGRRNMKFYKFPEKLSLND